MCQLPRAYVGLAFVALLFVLNAATAVHAQGRPGCAKSAALNVGAAIGRSSPYLELSRGLLDSTSRSAGVYAGFQLTGRADLAVAGPLMVRVEGTTARWGVEERIFDLDGFNARVVGRISFGHIDARQMTAAIGVRGAAGPLCVRWYGLIGGGVNSLSYRGEHERRRGVSLMAGFEQPIGALGAAQVDVQLQLIKTQDSFLGSMSAVPVASLRVGWMLRLK